MSLEKHDSLHRQEQTRSLTERLAADGYWPAQAAVSLAEGKYATAVRLCKESLADQSELVSGRLVYAQALYRAGQAESATEELHRVLALDPDNQVALKILGDIRFEAGELPSAMANYRRVLEIDPHSRGLSSVLKKPEKKATTRTITISRQYEPSGSRPTESLRDIPFVTETMGDLYLAQGHNRLAGEVFRRLLESNQHPRLAEKLARAEQGAGRAAGRSESRSDHDYEESKES